MIKSSKKFWNYLQSLVDNSEIVIDRPKGSKHPRFPQAPSYPLDYGFLDGTHAVDGAGVDCFVGSLNSKIVTGVLCTVDAMKKDCELKVLIGCTSDEMSVAYNHLNSPDFFADCLVVRED